MRNLTYNSCGNCVYAAVKQNDKGFFRLRRDVRQTQEKSFRI